MIRVGSGHDTHRLEAGYPLILGGIPIPHSHGLVGHSDADAVLHALTDALIPANLTTPTPDSSGDPGPLPPSPPAVSTCKWYQSEKLKDALEVAQKLIGCSNDSWSFVNSRLAMGLRVG